MKKELTKKICVGGLSCKRFLAIILVTVMTFSGLYAQKAKSSKMIPANDKSICYFGKWENDTVGNRHFTRSAYSMCYFHFTGDKIKFFAVTGPKQGICDVFLDGVYQTGADCYADKTGSACVFEKDGISGNTIHNLMIRLTDKTNEHAGGNALEIAGFTADQPVDYPSELKKQLEAEYELIQSKQKSWKKPDEWKPVAYRANMPEHGVKLLPGVVRNTFDSNIENLKHCFTIPHYCEGGNAPWLTPEEMKAGWSGALPASNEGRMLGGAAGVLCWEENPDMLAIVEKVVADIKARTRADGYYNYYTEERSYATDHWMHPKDPSQEPNHDGQTSERKNYDRVFWTRGMLAATKAGNTDAPTLLRRMYDWFNGQEQHLSHILVGGNATNGAPGGPLVYNSEIGKPEDIITSERFFDQDFWFKSFAERQPLSFSHFPGERPHCYELLPVEAIIDQYRATGDAKYFDALMGAWDIYNQYYKHTGGTSAICESSGPYPPGTYYVTTGHTGETCGSVFWTWINERLAQLYPQEEKYVAQIEEAIFNTLCNCRDSRGYTRYHMHLHGKKDWAANENSCCQVSSTIAISAIPKYIYMTDANTVFVNLMIASKFESPFGILTQETDFPKSGKVSITIEPSKANTRFGVSLRIPGWATGDVTVFVNGKPAGTGKSGDRFALNRTWKKGDLITYNVPAGLHLVRYTGTDQAENNLPRYTLMYGPLLMALDGGNADKKTIPHIKMRPEELILSLKSSGNELHFPVPETEWTFVPYSDAQEKGFTCLPVISEN
jgi:hypothetical protein